MAGQSVLDQGVLVLLLQEDQKDGSNVDNEMFRLSRVKGTDCLALSCLGGLSHSRVIGKSKQQVPPEWRRPQASPGRTRLVWSVESSSVSSRGCCREVEEEAGSFGSQDSGWADRRDGARRRRAPSVCGWRVVPDYVSCWRTLQPFWICRLVHYVQPALARKDSPPPYPAVPLSSSQASHSTLDLAWMQHLESANRAPRLLKPRRLVHEQEQVHYCNVRHLHLPRPPQTLLASRKPQSACSGACLQTFRDSSAAPPLHSTLTSASASASSTSLLLSPLLLLRLSVCRLSSTTRHRATVTTPHHNLVMLV